MDGSIVPAVICDPVFLDPQNEKTHS